MFSTPLYRIDRKEAVSQPTFLHSDARPPGGIRAIFIPLDPGNPAEALLAALYSSQKTALAASLFYLSKEIKIVELHLLVYCARKTEIGERNSDIKSSRRLISLPVTCELINFSYHQGKLWLLESSPEKSRLMTVANLNFVKEEQQSITRIWFLPNQIFCYNSQLPFFLFEDRLHLFSSCFTQDFDDRFVVCDISLDEKTTKQLFPFSLPGDRYVRPLLTRKIPNLILRHPISISMCANGWFHSETTGFSGDSRERHYYFSPDLTIVKYIPRGLARKTVDEEGILDMEEADLSAEQLDKRKYHLIRIEDLPEIEE
jgi:hypothetical protein